MLDPTFCETTQASKWADLSWLIFGWFSRPAQILPLIGACIGLPWLFQQWRWKRQISGFGGLLLLIYLLFTSATVARLGSQGLAALIPSDAPQPADAIVVLGRGDYLRPSRVETAAHLWQQQRAPLIFASGRGDAMEIASLLEQQAIPSLAIDGEPCSATTYENAEFTAAILQPQGVNRIILVTDPPHMLRSLLTFKGLGFEVNSYMSPIPDEFKSAQTRLLVLREWIGLLSYGIMGRYAARTVPETPWMQG